MFVPITSGKVKSALKVVVYGPEGIGKSTFAAQFPNPVFIDTEGSTKELDVNRMPRPSSWSILMEYVRYLKTRPDLFKTLVIDTADWAEQLCMTEICAKAHKDGIEDFGFGKGYVYLAEEFGHLLNLLEEIIELGMHVVIAAHATMRKFEQPDEMGAYDRWELKLQKKTAPLLMEWADMVLFANYKTYVVNVDGQGTQKGKNKAQGGKRVMYTTHTPCWDAKNRHGLKDELPFDFSEIAHCIIAGSPKTAEIPAAPTVPEMPPTIAPASAAAPAATEKPAEKETAKPDTAPAREQDMDGVPRALRDLMVANKVTVQEIQWVVATKGNGGRGYYPQDTPIANYDPDFIDGVLVGAWPQIYNAIIEDRKEFPFKQ